MCNSYRKHIKDLEDLLIVNVTKQPLNNYDLKLRGINILSTINELDKIKEQLVNNCFK
jgi:hypothetical protein